MSRTEVKQKQKTLKIPKPDEESLLGDGFYTEPSFDDNEDDFHGFNHFRLPNTQPPLLKRRRFCESDDYLGNEIDFFSTLQTEDVTPQHIISPEDRRALSEEVVKHGRPLKCPDTPVRTPLRRSFRRVSRPLVRGPQSDGMSLDMIEIVERLGEGDFGIVYKVRCKTDDKLYALKKMKEGYVNGPPSESDYGRLKFNGLDDPDLYSDYESVSRISPATSLLPIQTEDPVVVHEHEPSEEKVVKPIPFSLEEGEFDRKGIDEEEEDDNDPDDNVKSSPRMPTLHFSNYIPKKKKQIFEAEHQSAISDHPNIVGIKAFWEEANGQFCILSELCGSSLSTVISKNIDGLNEKTIAGYARDLLSALAHIHKHGVIHLDIKPSNILLSLDSSCLKITDFGQAYKKDSKAKPEEGDGRYMAPELLKDIYTPKADIFSLGMTLYELCRPGLVLPYQGDRWDALRHDNIDFRGWRYSKALMLLITKMLTSDYKQRPSADELLSNDYFKEILCDSKEIPFSDECSTVSSCNSPKKGENDDI